MKEANDMPTPNSPIKRRYYQLGWWPQNGRFDYIDETISMPIMKLQIGDFGEFLCAIPGSWFGMPPFTFGFLHVLFIFLQACFDSEVSTQAINTWFYFICCPVLIGSLFCFWKLLDSGDLSPAFKNISYLIIPCVLGPGYLAKIILGQRSAHSSRLFICCFGLSISSIQFIKVTAKRMRPVVSSADRLAFVHRRFTALQRVVVAGTSAFESFPSGDAGSAMGFSYLLYRYGCGNWAWSAVILSCFGRIFLHAHHLFDVLGACGIGFSISKLVVNYWGLDQGLGTIHVIFVLIIASVVNRILSEYLKFDIPAEFRSAVSHKARE